MWEKWVSLAAGSFNSLGMPAVLITRPTVMQELPFSSSGHKHEHHHCSRCPTMEGGQTQLEWMAG